MGPIETYKSVLKEAVLQSKPQMRRGPIETSDSDAKHAVVHAQNDRSYLEPIETCYCGPEVAVLQVITTGRDWDPQRLVILVVKALFCMQKPQMRAGTLRD